MKREQLDHLEKRLLDERARVMKAIAHFDKSFAETQQALGGDLSAYSFHMADLGTDAMEREKASLFASKEGRFLHHIDEALRRLYSSPDTFGDCVERGDGISFDRLDLLPHARMCIDCKQAEERGF